MNGRLEVCGDHGSEKMIYDVRMGPQGLFCDGRLFVVYQASRERGAAHPHIVCRDPEGRWSDPVRIGTAARPDHHLAPVIWLDDRRHFHVLYHCHFVENESCHIVSSRPLDISRWEHGRLLASSITYPRVLTCPDGRRVLYYRALGHMGYWTYRLSEDGRHWSPPAGPLVDFDQKPQLPGDEWSGSYHSVALGADGNTLHVAFVRWDERRRINPLYGRFLNLDSRYDLYSLAVDLRTGRAFNIRGEELELPVTRHSARTSCLVWETGEHITNMPSILVDSSNRPQFLLPVAEEVTDRCRFWFIRREGSVWKRYPVAATDSIWNASYMEYGENGGITAFLISRAPGHRGLPYGGGRLEEWRSADGGRHWHRAGAFGLPRGFLANNPRPVEDATGRSLKRTLLFFMWKGPGAIQPSGPFRAKAYLWQDRQAREEAHTALRRRGGCAG